MEFRLRSSYIMGDGIFFCVTCLLLVHNLVISFSCFVNFSCSCSFNWIFILLETHLFNIIFISYQVHLHKAIWLQQDIPCSWLLLLGSVHICAWTTSLDARSTILWLLTISFYDGKVPFYVLAHLLGTVLICAFLHCCSFLLPL